MILLFYNSCFFELLVRQETTHARIIGHMAHAQGDLTFELEAYKGYGLTPSEVSELGTQVAAPEDWEKHLNQVVSLCTRN